MPDTPKHLLLVEDEAPLREAIAEQLADRGFIVEQAESGQAALERLTDFAFDIIVTDLRLPGLDGSALVQAAVVPPFRQTTSLFVSVHGTTPQSALALHHRPPLAATEALTVMVTVLELAGEPVAQGKEEVIRQETVFPLTKVPFMYVALFVPTLLPFSFH